MDTFSSEYIHSDRSNLSQEDSGSLQRKMKYIYHQVECLYMYDNIHHRILQIPVQLGIEQLEKRKKYFSLPKYLGNVLGQHTTLIYSMSPINDDTLPGTFIGICSENRANAM